MNKQNILLDFEDFKNSEKSNKLAEFLGWHIGDGCLSVNKRYSEYTLTGDLTEEYDFYKNIIIPAFQDLFGSFFNKRIELKKYESNGVCGIYLFNKDFVEFLHKSFNLPKGKKIDIKIPKLIKTDRQKISFLRGLFDTDGSIYYCKSNAKTKNESLYTKFHFELPLG